jgi:hypothetical protein
VILRLVQPSGCSTCEEKEREKKESELEEVLHVERKGSSHIPRPKMKLKLLLSSATRIFT